MFEPPGTRLDEKTAKDDNENNDSSAAIATNMPNRWRSREEVQHVHASLSALGNHIPDKFLPSVHLAIYKNSYNPNRVFQPCFSTPQPRYHTPPHTPS